MEEQVIEVGKQELTRYLTRHNLRKTQERYAMLEAIFSMEGHFTVDAFYEYLEEKFSFHVSKATIYSNLEIFMRANLVVKLQLGTMTMYERLDVLHPHYHLVCMNCGKIMEKSNKELHESLISTKVRGFSALYYSLCMYGTCSACARMKKNNKKKQ